LKESKKRKILNESSKPNIISENVKTSFIKSTIQHYFTGFICYVINQTGQIKSHFIRNFAYTKILRIDIEKHAIIYGGAEIRTLNMLKIGKGTIIGNFAILDARNGINNR
jgi:hypothetical protein